MPAARSARGPGRARAPQRSPKPGQRRRWEKLDDWHLRKAHGAAPALGGRAGDTRPESPPTFPASVRATCPSWGERGVRGSAGRRLTPTGSGAPAYLLMKPSPSPSHVWNRRRIRSSSPVLDVSLLPLALALPAAAIMRRRLRGRRGRAAARSAGRTRRSRRGPARRRSMPSGRRPAVPALRVFPSRVDGRCAVAEGRLGAEGRERLVESGSPEAAESPGASSRARAP